MSDMDRAIIYSGTNQKPFKLDEVVARVTAMSVEEVAKMTYEELAAKFPKYTSGEFRELQHGAIWDKLEELGQNLPTDCKDFARKIRIIRGIRSDGMSA